MPIVTYRCKSCGLEDARVAGPDDKTILCPRCGSMMVRASDDKFFQEMSPNRWNSMRTNITP